MLEGIIMRLSRVVAPGYPHHVTQCGNRRRPLFFDNGDYSLYLELLSNGNTQFVCPRFMVQLAWAAVPGYPHRVTQRGNRRQPAFSDVI